MAGAIGGLRLIDAEANHHVEMFGEQLFDHGRRARRIVGGVAVDHHIDVGIDVGEHPPDHMALALMRLAAHLGARLAGHGHGAIPELLS